MTSVPPRSTPAGPAHARAPREDPVRRGLQRSVGSSSAGSPVGAFLGEHVARAPRVAARFAAYWAGTRRARCARGRSRGTPSRRGLGRGSADPAGSTMSYGELAETIGARRQAARWARERCDPCGFVIPCHRVIGKTARPALCGGRFEEAPATRPRGISRLRPCRSHTRALRPLQDPGRHPILAPHLPAAATTFFLFSRPHQHHDQPRFLDRGRRQREPRLQPNRLRRDRRHQAMMISPRRVRRGRRCARRRRWRGPARRTPPPSDPERAAEQRS